MAAKPPRTPADAARRAGKPLAKPRPAEGPRRMDLYHVLSAGVGSLLGLVIFSALTPGHLPDAPVVERRDARLDVALRNMAGRIGPDGYFHVTGEIQNGREQACKRLTVGVTILEGDRELTRTLATLEDIPANGRKPFEVKAFAAGANAFEAAVDLAQF